MLVGIARTLNWPAAAGTACTWVNTCGAGAANVKVAKPNNWMANACKGTEKQHYEVPGCILTIITGDLDHEDTQKRITRTDRSTIGNFGLRLVNPCVCILRLTTLFTPG